MNPELIKLAGVKAGVLSELSFTDNAEAIAEFIRLKKIEKGKDVTIKLGTFKLKTVGEDLHIKFDADLPERTDIGSDTAIVSLDPDLFDEDKEGKE